MPLIRSESWAFIWQPKVVTWYLRTRGTVGPTEANGQRLRRERCVYPNTTRQVLLLLSACFSSGSPFCLNEVVVCLLKLARHHLHHRFGVFHLAADSLAVSLGSLSRPCRTDSLTWGKLRKGAAAE